MLGYSERAYSVSREGSRHICALSGGAVGSQLNLDAVYFYEK